MPTDDKTGVLRKSFLILETVVEERSPVSLKDLTRRVKLSKPTVYRLSELLCDLGYLLKNEDDGKYMASLKVVHLAHKTQCSDLAQQTLPVMERLHAEFNETINLGILKGIEVHYLHTIESTRALRHMTSPHASDYYYSTALGKAFVAFLPPEEQDAILARTEMRPVTSKTLKSVDALKSELKKTRKRGWAFDNEESEEGVVCFGVPLLRNDRPLVALSLSMPKMRLTPALKKEIVQELKSIRS